MENALLTAALEDAITQLKSQERAMAARAEASERLSGQIVASLTAGLVVVDLDGQVRIVNPSSRRLLGLPDGPLAGSFRDVLGKASPLVAVIDECLREGHPILRRTLELNDARTTVTHLGVTVSPLVSDAGVTSGVICLFTDLSKIADLEDQLRLKDTLARLGELTAGLAHEFRNGLATIHGYARLLDLDALVSPQRTYVEGLRAETDALGQIVTNFLNFARPTQLAVAPSPQPLAERVADDIRADAERSGTRGRRRRVATVDGDEVLLRQAISNLARNALKRVRKPASCRHPDLRRGRSRGAPSAPPRHRQRPGIDPAHRERIFRPSSRRSRRARGWGWPWCRRSS
jgi:signal transduction histidine kinase